MIVSDKKLNLTTVIPAKETVPQSKINANFELHDVIPAEAGIQKGI